MADQRTKDLQAATNKVILTAVADPTVDIKNERKKATFSVNALSELLYGSADAVKRRKEILDYMSKEPDFNLTAKHYSNREEMIEMGLKGSFKLFDTALEWGTTNMDDLQTVRRAYNTPTGVDLHYGMFLPTLQNQASAEQLEEILPKAMSFQILGTYAQTELGHGTFLRGLETTATYDHATHEFIIHSPTITATKWWPGGLGKTANHAVLMARLFIDGKDYGPHAFFVQLRRLEDHQPLPGIEVGEIGAKFGFNAVDNGFLRFDHVRVPRSAMLSKLAQIDDSGKYVRAPGVAEKANYGTMVFVRAGIVYSSTYSIAQAITIAIRYSAVRRQTSTQPGQLETQVIDYQTQQHNLFPLIALSFALHFTGEFMMSMYRSFQDNSNSKEALEILPELHAASAGLKSLTTTLAANGIEVCRKSCGGHGYSVFSGLPHLYADVVAACTYEGENTVMALQTARYLLKNAQQSLSGQALTGQSKYLQAAATKVHLEVCSVVDGADFLNPNVQLAAFHHRAARIIFAATEEYNKSIKEGVNPDVAWNNVLVDFVHASHAHCYQMLLSNFIQAITSLRPGPVRDVLKTMCDLFALSVIEQQIGDFTEDGYVNRRQALLLHKQVRSLLQAVRPNAVALVDAWQFSDYELNSALGQYDGDVYQTLFKWAKNSPLNAKHTPPGYEKYLKPRFTSQL